MLTIYNLPNQLPGEEVIKIIRRDQFILIKKIILFSILIIFPLSWLLLADVILPNLFNYPVADVVIGLIFSIYYLFIFLFFFFSLIDYYLDVWIITSERLIKIEQNGFFSREIVEQRIGRVQDVTSQMQGFWQTIFKYGFVYVQTAGASERLIFEEVPEPENIRDLIIRLAESHRPSSDPEDLLANTRPTDSNLNY